MTPGNRHCAGCDRMLYTATAHIFTDTTAYCPDCCPTCRADAGFTPVPATHEPTAVTRAKRGHRRGTPTAWAMRGVGS